MISGGKVPFSKGVRFASEGTRFARWAKIDRNGYDHAEECLIREFLLYASIENRESKAP